jgi:ABC-type multidrug transport system fused ATPase/permease subunit
MRVVGFFLEEMPRSIVSIERIDGVLAEPVSPTPEDPVGFPHGGLTVEFDLVRYGYADNEVLRDVSFEVVAGEIVALVGATGAGKTTICNLLMRADDPHSGCIRVGGVDLRAADVDARCEKIAMVFQESYLFADTIRENITLGRPTTDGELRAAASVAQVDRFIDEMPEGFESVVGERGVTLSGGQRQRVALARALVRSPRVLVLDDATSAVDPTVESRILRGLRGSLEASTLVVAHRLSTIQLADRVVFLDGARIVATGAHDDLLRLPSYEAIVRAYEDDA